MAVEWRRAWADATTKEVGIGAQRRRYNKQGDGQKKEPPF
jgi:hypothetical protein